jgi:hypothetical protein
MSQRPRLTSATCETHRNVGPRGVHGGVALTFERASAFKFSSSAQWPDDNYDSVVEQAVKEALAELELASSYSCHLETITWHPVDSCAAAFRFVAEQATRAALQEIKPR